MIKEIICIVCPLGCNLLVEYDKNKILKVSGNRCRKAKKYSEKEIFSPSRILTTTVNTCTNIVLPVRSHGDIPKAKIIKVIRELANIKIEKTTKAGDIVISNILNTGVDIVATDNIEIIKCFSQE